MLGPDSRACATTQPTPLLSLHSLCALGLRCQRVSRNAQPLYGLLNIGPCTAAIKRQRKSPPSPVQGSHAYTQHSYTTILTILFGTHINRFIAVSSATYRWMLSIASTKDFISSSPV